MCRQYLCACVSDADVGGSEKWKVKKIAYSTTLTGGGELAYVTNPQATFILTDWNTILLRINVNSFSPTPGILSLL